MESWGVWVGGLGPPDTAKERGQACLATETRTPHPCLLFSPLAEALTSVGCFSILLQGRRDDVLPVSLQHRQQSSCGPFFHPQHSLCRDLRAEAQWGGGTVPSA